MDETDENAEVIDLTERRSEEHEMSKQQREFLQQQRDLRMRHTLQISEGLDYLVFTMNPYPFRLKV